ncbi:MAG: nucleotidyltransferase domain-containing protein [Nanoarchaeota archaeon]
MIKNLLPLTEQKLKILKYIYEEKEIHMLNISKNLKIHPYSLSKTLKSLNLFLVKNKRGKTISLSLNKNLNDYLELLYILEDYKLETDNNILRLLIKNLKIFFPDVLSCVIFGSYARLGKGNDVDLLFIIKKQENILESCNKLSTLLNKEINPIIMKEMEFEIALKEKEPTISSLLEPSQRLLVIGKEYFLKKVMEVYK